MSDDRVLDHIQLFENTQTESVDASTFCVLHANSSAGLKEDISTHPLTAPSDMRVSVVGDTMQNLLLENESRQYQRQLKKMMFSLL